MTFSPEQSREVTLAAENRELRHDLGDLVEHLDRMVEAIEEGLMTTELCLKELKRLKSRTAKTLGVGLARVGSN